MSPVITVREYARLTTQPVTTQTLDLATVSVSAFDWLCRLSASFSRGGASLVQIEDRYLLRLDNYVGILETPCGTKLEILPKHVEDACDPARSRALLIQMITGSLDLPAREASEASLTLFDAPLSEWVISKFLVGLQHLIKRGVRSDYTRIEAGERYLQGQLDTVRQMRQPPGSAHIFQIRRDIFSPDRAENRILKLALDIVCRTTQKADNWRLAHELVSLLHDIPASRDVVSDLKNWRQDRLMAHYQPLRPWCELILYRQMPLALAGEWHGISMLFPMEKLFERYVGTALRRAFVAGARLTLQAARHSLCEHLGEPVFQLRPDMLLEYQGRSWILDAKWKLLDASDRAGKYGLSQADIYQLFAYGQKYLNGVGEMVLIYPRHRRFDRSPLEFDFGGGLKLIVVAFDLEQESIVGEGETGLPLRKYSEGARSSGTSRY